MAFVRLDKYMAERGVASRKEIRTIVKTGRVTVNGTVAAEPDMKLDPGSAEVALDGVAFQSAKFRYFMLDKPPGVVTATEDKKQQTVIDLLPAELRRIGLFPVGRLDKDTTGLLLLTNDGEFAHRVISPKTDTDKVYFAVTEGVVTAADALAFKAGLELKDGLKCLPAELTPLEGNTCLVTVKEGKYHQVKRMLASRGKPVLELRRLQIGRLQLDEQSKPGDFRELSAEDLCKVL